MDFMTLAMVHHFVSAGKGRKDFGADFRYQWSAADDIVQWDACFGESDVSVGDPFGNPCGSIDP